MQKLLFGLTTALMFAAGFAFSQSKRPSLVVRGGWVAGYIESWEYNNPYQGITKADIIAMGCFTHIYWVCANNPGSDGSIDWQLGAKEMLLDGVPVMGSHGIKSIFQMCCNWTAAIGNSTAYAGRKALITNLCNVLATYKMDGIDVDWEPPGPQFPSFVAQLRDSLDARFGASPRKLLAAYVDPSAGSMCAKVAGDLDHINIQGYDLVNPGWSACSNQPGLHFRSNQYDVVWHQGPTYSGGANCPQGNPMWNMADVARKFVEAGVPSVKIGISARWNASVWRGGTGTSTGGVSLPLQTWTSSPLYFNDLRWRDWSQSGVSQATFDALTPVHDSAAGATYLSSNPPGSSNDAFLSYDDGWASAQKVKLVQDSLYGGVYVWTISGRRTENGRVPQADSLKAAAKR